MGDKHLPVQLSHGGEGSLIIGPLIVLYFGRRPALVAASTGVVLGLVWWGALVWAAKLQPLIPSGKRWFWAGKPFSGALLTGPNQGCCSQASPLDPGRSPAGSWVRGQDTERRGCWIYRLPSWRLSAPCRSRGGQEGVGDPRLEILVYACTK